MKFAERDPEFERITHLPTHEVVNAEGQIADRPLAECFRVSEPKRIGQGVQRLEPRGGRLRRSPREPLPRRSHLREISTPIAVVVVGVNLRRQPPIKDVVDKYGGSGGGRHCPRRHRIERSRLKAQKNDSTPALAN